MEFTPMPIAPRRTPSCEIANECSGTEPTSPRMNASASCSVYGDGITGIQRAISQSLSSDERGDVVFGPRPQHKVAVAELHPPSLRPVWMGSKPVGFTPRTVERLGAPHEGVCF